MKVVQSFIWVRRRGEGAESTYYAKYARRRLGLDSTTVSIGIPFVGFLFGISADIFHSSSPHPSGDHYLDSLIIRLQDGIAESPLRIKVDKVRRHIVRVSSDDIILL